MGQRTAFAEVTFLHLLLFSLIPFFAAAAGQCRCPTDEGVLTLKDKNEERPWESGGSSTAKEGVHIKRRKCRLRFTDDDCVTYEKTVEIPAAERIAEEAAKPKSIVLLMKLGVGSPFEGDRAKILLKVVADVMAHGGVELRFLIDQSQWVKAGFYGKASTALPPELEPLVVQYSISDIQRQFPTKTLKPRDEPPVKARARAIGKYYETYSWGWWWAQHRQKQHQEAAEGGGGVVVKRVYVAEDDTVFTGNWAELLSTIEEGLQEDVEGSSDGAAADVIAFRDYCTPQKSWIWARYMHEGWGNLTTPGQGLETWMTLSGFSPKFLDTAVAQQRQGVCGHVEWFPPTLALREGLGMVFVEHDLRGKKLGHSCPGGGAVRGGTFNYCCQGANTVDAENFFEGWKESGACVKPTILHPVKGDACGRFSADGFGRGCWKRESNPAYKGHGGDATALFWKDVHVLEASGDAKNRNAFKALSAGDLLRVLNH